jgi:hypothetical protein
MAGLVESKSLTKGAIGLCYARAGIADEEKLAVIGDKVIRVGDALRHTSGISGDVFDYDGFVGAKDATRFALDALRGAPGVEGFSYNDYMYQILATRFVNLSGGKTLPEVFASIVGPDFHWRVDGMGVPLGPNGLELSPETARKMGEAARRLLQGRRRATLPKEGAWWLGHNARLRRYVQGWWETEDGTLIAIGFRRYYIIVPVEGPVRVQLFDDDYEENTLTAEQVAFAAPVWQRPILITVPHAVSRRDARGSHPRDFSAPLAADLLQAALVARGLQHITRIDGDTDRAEKDWNRGAWDPEGPIEAWVAAHGEEGILLDVHSFPGGHNWNNPTAVFPTTEVQDAGSAPLVVLLPVEHRDFGRKDIGATVYQGSEVNKIINLGVERSILLEFHEALDAEWPLDKLADMVVAEAYYLE